MRTVKLQSFIMGYLGIETPTKDPFAAYPALEALDRAVTSDTKQARLLFNFDPSDFGKKLKERDGK
jgi:hypothetical protein